MFNIGYELIKDRKVSKKKESIDIDEESLYKYIKLKINKIKRQGFEIVSIKIADKLNLNVRHVGIKGGDIVIYDINDLTHTVRKISSRKDYQQKMVYSWENEVFSKYGIYKSIYNREKMIKYINFVLKRINEDEVAINFIGNQNYSSFNYNYQLNNNEVFLNFSDLMLNKFIALHELSHYLVYKKRLNDVGHGSFFLGIYAYLIIRFINVSKDLVYKTLDDRGLDYISYKEAKIIIDKQS